MFLIELQCLPPLCVYTKGILHKKILFEQFENYQKRSFRNRIHLMGPNGPVLFSIPLKKGKNEQQPITKVAIANDCDWLRDFRNKLKACYGRSPYFSFYADELISVFQQHQTYLFTLNKALFEWSVSKMELPIQHAFTTEFVDEVGTGLVDLRNCIRPVEVSDLCNYSFEYVHVFDETNTFIPHLSIIDLLFCAGPESIIVLQRALETMCNEGLQK